jgi:WD40 repeat protein
MTTRRTALIVATDRYEDPKFSQLRAPVHDAEALARVLRDPAIGEFDVRVLNNPPWHMVRVEVESFFADRRRDDLLLLYFSCHGVKDQSGQLYFATTDTQFRWLAATGISSSFVNEQMNRSRSRRIVLLLDCCYSGAFTRGLLPRAGRDVDVTERFEGGGRAVITASSAMEYAFEGAELSEAAEPTPSVFTSVVVRGLETGAADHDGDGLVSVDDLYEYVFDEVRKGTTSQTPTMFATVQGPLHLARNPRPLAALPEDVRRAIASELAWEREGVVARLVAMLGSGSATVAGAARHALERLADDDSRRVTEAARRALSPHPDVRPDTGPREQPEPAERTGPTTASTPVLFSHDGLRVSAVDFSPDSSRLATAGNDKTARVWELVGGRELARVVHDRSISALAFSPAGDRLATGSDDRTARIWELDSGRELVRVVHDGAIRDVAFSPDGTRLATASEDKTARVWELDSGREQLRLWHAGLLEWVLATAFAPDGDRLATGTLLWTVRIWELATGSEIGRLRCGDSVRAVAFSSDGRLLATGSEDRTARLWELASGREVARLAHGQAVAAVAFATQGDRLASGSDDTTARLWEVATGRELARAAHPEAVTAVGFSPDGRFLATGCADAARVWLLEDLPFG